MSEWKSIENLVERIAELVGEKSAIGADMTILNEQEVARAAISEIFDWLAEPKAEWITATVRQVGDPLPADWDVADSVAEALGGDQVLGAAACAELARDFRAMLTQARKEALGDTD